VGAIALLLSLATIALSMFRTRRDAVEDDADPGPTRA
jgi:hypothetical protein